MWEMMKKTAKEMEKEMMEGITEEMTEEITKEIMMTIPAMWDNPCSFLPPSILSYY
jgi:hypothetical protein